MNKVVIGIGAAVVALGGILAALYLRGHPSQAPQAPQSGWVVVQHPPGDRATPKVNVVREFGPWHLLCRDLPQQTPKFGAIQNLGIASSNPMAAANTCHVYTMMTNTEDRRQTLLLDFRYTQGNSGLRIVALHTLPSRVTEPPPPPHPIANLDRITNKIIAERTPTNRDVRLQLGQQSVVLGARGCRNGRCFATFPADGDLADGLGPNTAVIVHLPPVSKGEKVRVVRLPGQGLSQALSALRQLTPS